MKVLSVKNKHNNIEFISTDYNKGKSKLHNGYVAPQTDLIYERGQAQSQRIRNIRILLIDDALQGKNISAINKLILNAKKFLIKHF